MHMSSTGRLGPSQTAWLDLSAKLRDFSRVCLVDETTPAMIIGFARTERLFNDFIRRAKVIFNDARPAAALRAPVSTERAAGSLLTEWWDFARSFLSVLNQSVAPLYPMMADRLDDLARVLQRLSALFGDPQPLLAIGPIRRVKAVIDTLRNDADRLAVAARTDGWIGFDPFRLQRIEAQARSLFSDVIPKNCLIVSGIAGSKKELLRAADAVVAVAEAMADFDRRSREVTDAILAMDETMGALFAELAIPTRPREEIATPADDEVFETTAVAAVENCDMIRARIAQMEHAIADTSALYRTNA
jgi:hypothetical protein